MKFILSKNTLLKSITVVLLISNVLNAQIIPHGTAPYPSGTVPPLVTPNFVPGIKVNYVRTTLLSKPVTTEAAIQATDYNQTRVQTQYLDGLGRALQLVNHFASPERNDVVTQTKYDLLGRDAWHFLPYSKSEPSAAANGKFKLTAFSDQIGFYKNTLGYTADNYFYTQTNYEASPLNRVIKTLPQGNSWVGTNRGSSMTLTPLPAGTNIRIFTIAYAPASLPVTSAEYGPGDLIVKTTTDEDGNFTEEYITKDNLLILKATGKNGTAGKLQTYYVYDDFGLLQCVIPPKATTWLAANNWTLTLAVCKELCFTYVYDHRLRLMGKDPPGVSSQYTIHNLKDEIVFTQNQSQRSKAEWLFNKYDVLGRLIQNGVYNVGTSLLTIQETANTPYTGTNPFLTYLFKDIYGNASYVNTFPNAKVLTTYYYDDYSFTSRTYDASFMNSLSTGWNTNVSNETTNLLTGTKVVVLDEAATPTELITVNFYNDRGLLIQTQAQNHKGGWNITTNTYDFLGQKLATYTEINNPQAADNAKIKTIENFSYDHSGRLKDNYHSINDLAGKACPLNTYDDAGRLIGKTFANSESQAMQYEYNIRGWLTGINRAYCLSGTGEESFGMELSYDYGYTVRYYNGNIAGTKWRNKGKPTELRSYGYAYDNYNRLKTGSFLMQMGVFNPNGGWSAGVRDYNVSNLTYDENGNILSMKQMGVNAAGQKILLDDLSYTYNPNSNKLASVTESASSQSKNPTAYDNLGDFRDVAGATDYTYNSDGNLLTDANKSLTFTYDELINKTKRVTKGTQNVDYLYDAQGNKLQKKVSPGSTTTTDYVGPAVYIDNKLSFISHPEGRIRWTSSGTPYMYDYFIKDHLGSTRSVITYTNGGPITGFAKSEKNAETEVTYIATCEPENAAKENQLFDNIELTRGNNPNKKTADDKHVARLSSKNSKTILGPDITLKVMAGDKVKISAEALIIAEKNNPNEVVKNVVGNFITAFTIPPALASEGINILANSNMKELATSILNLQQKNADEKEPKAFLNYILYDEYMHLIPEGSGAIQIKNKDGWQTLETGEIEIPQNGFLRVFSNNMETAPVNINNTMLAIVTGKLVEEYNYYPYGLVFDQTQASTAIKKTDYLYNGKELQHNEFGQGNGLELEDYGARLYDVQVGRWTQVDPLAEISRKWSPYCYAFDNPMRFIDPDGRTGNDVILGGSEKQKAFTELQASVQGQLNLTMDANGKVSYVSKENVKLSKSAEQLSNAINDNSVIVNVNAENTSTTESGNLYVGGSFSGNTVTKGVNGNTVVAKQEVNPEVLSKASAAHGSPGADILHEVTEAYQGGLISQKNGVSSPAAGQPRSVYEKAHNRATNQSGEIFERIYDGKGSELQMTPSGAYPQNVKSADWYVNDKKGNKIVSKQQNNYERFNLFFIHCNVITFLFKH